MLTAADQDFAVAEQKAKSVKCVLILYYYTLVEYPYFLCKDYF